MGRFHTFEELQQAITSELENRELHLSMAQSVFDIALNNHVELFQQIPGIQPVEATSKFCRDTMKASLRNYVTRAFEANGCNFPSWRFSINNDLASKWCNFLKWPNIKINIMIPYSQQIVLDASLGDPNQNRLSFLPKEGSSILFFDCDHQKETPFITLKATRNTDGEIRWYGSWLSRVTGLERQVEAEGVGVWWDQVFINSEDRFVSSLRVIIGNTYRDSTRFVVSLKGSIGITFYKRKVGDSCWNATSFYSIRSTTHNIVAQLSYSSSEEEERTEEEEDGQSTATARYDF